MPGQPILNDLDFRIGLHGGEEALLRRAANGESLDIIAKSFGRSAGLLYRWRTQRRHPEPRHRFRAARFQSTKQGKLDTAIENYGGFPALLRDMLSGRNAQDVIAEFGVSWGTMYRWLHRDRRRRQLWKSVAKI